MVRGGQPAGDVQRRIHRAGVATLLLALAGLAVPSASATHANSVPWPPERPCDQWTGSQLAFFDDFDSVAVPSGDILHSVGTLTRWDVLRPGVDLLGPDPVGYMRSWGSVAVDLDAGSGGLIQTKDTVVMAQGDQVAVQWLQAGNSQTTSGWDGMGVSLGPWSTTVSASYDDDWGAQNFTFTAPSAQVAAMAFDMQGSDGAGILVDNVRICVIHPAAAGNQGTQTAANTTAAKQPPVPRPVPQQTARVGVSMCFTVTATDGDTPGENLTFSFVAAPPASEFLNHKFCWTPSKEDVGYSCTMQLVVEDTDHLQTSESVCIRVIDEAPDRDMDGVADSADDCPSVRDREQTDHDGDGIGDVCDPRPCHPGPEAASDRQWDGPADCNPATRSPGATSQAATTNTPPADLDTDGVADFRDDCPLSYDPDQADQDLDRVGDACDSDADGDGVAEWAADPAVLTDNCPAVPNPDQRDRDGDGVGDACQTAPAKPRMTKGSCPTCDARIKAQANAPDSRAAAGSGVLGVLAALAAVAGVQRRSRKLA